MTGGGQRLQIGHGAELGLDLAEARDRVAAVAATVHGVEEGHEVQVVDARLFQIIELPAHAVERARELVDVEAHAEQVVALVPARVLFPLAVPLLERGAAAAIAAAQRFEQLVQRLALLGVKGKEERFQLLLPRGKAAIKLRIHE